MDIYFTLTYNDDQSVQEWFPTVHGDVNCSIWLRRLGNFHQISSLPKMINLMTRSTFETLTEIFQWEFGLKSRANDLRSALGIDDGQYRARVYRTDTERIPSCTEFADAGGCLDYCSWNQR